MEPVHQNKWLLVRKDVDTAELADRQLGTATKTWALRKANRVQLTSGTLVVGKKYRISSYLGSDVFTNVGASINATMPEDKFFVATGTTPTTWTSSTVLDIVGTERIARIPARTEAIYLAFFGSHSSDPVNGTCSVNIHMYPVNGPAIEVGDYDIVIGDQDMVLQPWDGGETALKTNYADQISPVSEKWFQKPTVVGSAEDDGIAMLKIPTFGSAVINVEFEVIGSGMTVGCMMRSVNQIPHENRNDEIRKVVFPTISWVNSEGHAAKTTTVRNVNMLIERIDLIVSAATSNPTITVVSLKDENGVDLLNSTDITNSFTTIADDSKHIRLSTRASADFDAVPVAGDLTFTIDLSADTSTSGITVVPILYGP